MSKSAKDGLFSLNDEQMSNWVGVKHLPDNISLILKFHVELLQALVPRPR